jgi:hypothetical protein
VIEEVITLTREVKKFTNEIEADRGNLSPDIQSALDELETGVVLAKKYTDANAIDFRRAEIGLQEIRALKSDIQRVLDESITNAPNN